MQSLYLFIFCVYLINACPMSYDKRDSEQDEYDMMRNQIPEMPRDYQGMDKFGTILNRNREKKKEKRRGPILGFGPFKENQHNIEDRGYDLGYLLGTDYGKKLGKGIKTGIGASVLKGLLDGGGGGKAKKEQDKEDDDDEP